MHEAMLPRCRVLGWVALIVFAGLSAAIQFEATRVADVVALQWIVDRVPAMLVHVSRGVGTWPYTAALVLFEIGLLLVFARRRAWDRIGFLLAAVIGSYLINPALKLLFARERPISPHDWDQAAGYAFPSGHAMAAATVATAIVILFWRSRYRNFAWFGAALFMAVVGGSRLFIGAHYPTDVLAGWAAGTAWVVACSALILQRGRTTRVDSQAMVKDTA